MSATTETVLIEIQAWMARRQMSQCEPVETRWQESLTQDSRTL